MAREEYDKPAERLMVALESAVSRQLGHALALEVEAAQARSEAQRLGRLARVYGKLPANRVRPVGFGRTHNGLTADDDEAA
jgi:hypothetical protein